MCNSLTRIFFSFSGHFPSETETERKPDVQNEAAESDKGKVVPPKVHSCKPEQQIITQPIEKKEAFVVVRVIFYKKTANTETSHQLSSFTSTEATANLRYT